MSSFVATNYFIAPIIADTFNDLPDLSTSSKGRQGLVLDAPTEYVWDGTVWVALPDDEGVMAAGIGNETAQPVTVPAAGTTVVAVLDVSRMERVFVEIDVATQTLDGFIIKGRPSGGVTQHTLFSTSGDYTSPGGLLVGTSGDLTGVAAGNKGWFIMDVQGIEELQLEASAVADSASVTVIAGGA